MKSKFEKAALAQRIQVINGENYGAKIENKLKCTKEETDGQYCDIEKLENEMESLFNILGCEMTESESELEMEFMTEEEKKAIYEFVHRDDDEFSSPISYYNEEQYYTCINKYLNQQGFSEENDPIFSLFSTEELLKKIDIYEKEFRPLKWSKTDYTVIGITAVIAILVDIFIVAIPEDMKFLGKEYKGSKVTKKLKEITTNWYENSNQNSKFGQWMHNSLKKLEEYAKVPYDIAANNKKKGIDIDGLNPSFHRFMELGHDPILGFIFGIIDILRGTCTVIDKNGILHILDVGNNSLNFFGAFIKVFAHLLSDVFTSAGIAPPFMSILQLCTGKSPFILRKNGEKVTFNNLVRFMYKHGYDMRHMLTMGIVPCIVELSIRIYFDLSNHDVDLKNTEDSRYKLKKSNMLMICHSITSAGNVLKTFLYGWNPLALNYSEFLMLIKTTIVTIKANAKANAEYSEWFNKELEKELEKEWKSLLF